MTPQAKKKLIGAIIAAACAIAVYYGLIDQKQADSIRTQADQTLGNGSAQQPAPQASPAPTTAQNPPPAPTTTPSTPSSAPAAPAPQGAPPH